MIEFIRWQVRLWLVAFHERIANRARRIEADAPWTRWLSSPFQRFVDRVSRFDPFEGYQRRRLRRWLFMLRYPWHFERRWSLKLVLAVIRPFTPEYGLGRYSGHLDPRNMLKAEWLDTHNEYADASTGDLTVYPFYDSLFREASVPWSRQPESWIVEKDEMGFVTALQFENATEAKIAFGGAEYRYEKSLENDELRPFLVTLDSGQAYRFWSENEDHAREQAENAEPNRTVVTIELEDEDNLDPRCDLCGEAFEDGGEGEDWNGDTGNHFSCEREAHNVEGDPTLNGAFG